MAFYKKCDYVIYGDVQKNWISVNFENEKKFSALSGCILAEYLEDREKSGFQKDFESWKG